MANSGHQHQHRHHHHQHKISPRKFSEKIALLNKKEAEGNAEFEEIIKEVQATRSVNSVKTGNNDNNRTGFQDKKQAELEEVFENLIQCVGQYEQELQDSQQPINLNDNLDTSSAIVANASSQNINNHNEYRGRVGDRPLASSPCNRPASVELKASNRMATGCVDVTRSNRIGLDMTHSNSNGLHNRATVIQSSNTLALDPYGRPVNYLALGLPENQAHNTNNAQYEAHVSNLEALKANVVLGPANQLHNFYSGTNTCQQADVYQQQPNQMRTRVTSIGSANYQNLCSNNNQWTHQRGYQCQSDGCWHSSCNQHDVYLRPACDKTICWQKSCSDSALHVPSQSSATGELVNRSVCSENPLAMEVEAYNNDDNTNRATTISVDASGCPMNTLMEEEQRDNQVYQNRRGPGDDVGTVQSTNGYMGGTDQINAAADFRETFEQSEYLVESTKRSSGQHPVFDGQGGSRNQPPVEQQQLYHQQANITNDVPGINICMIEDDGAALETRLKLEANQQACSSRDSSLPDISNLQFNINDESSIHQNGLQNSILNEPINPIAVDLNNFQQGVDTSAPDYNIAPQEWYPINQPKAVTSTIITGQHQQVNNSLSSSACKEEPSTNWRTSSSNTKEKGALCEPKIEQHLLSNSDCGLQNTLDYECSQNHQFGANIIRSHSHNSIDDYANKHKITYHPHHLTGNPFKPPLAPHHSNNSMSQRCQRQSYGMGGHQVILGQKTFLVKDNASQISMEPQLGSISPIDSSSNLASPQSEQNSPGSITVEHTETCLPYLSSEQPNSFEQRTSQELYSNDNIDNIGIYGGPNII